MLTVVAAHKMLPYLFIWLSLALLTIVDAQGMLTFHLKVKGETGGLEGEGRLDTGGGSSLKFNYSNASPWGVGGLEPVGPPPRAANVPISTSYLLAYRLLKLLTRRRLNPLPSYPPPPLPNPTPPLLPLLSSNFSLPPWTAGSSRAPECLPASGALIWVLVAGGGGGFKGTGTQLAYAVFQPIQLKNRNFSNFFFDIVIT